MHLLKPLEVIPEEGHGSLGPGRAQLHDTVLQQLLDVVLLHVELTLPQAPLLLAVRAAGCHDELETPRRKIHSKPNQSETDSSNSFLSSLLTLG